MANKELNENNGREMANKELNENNGREMANKELDDLVKPANSENSDSEEEGKTPLTYKRLKDLLKKLLELSDFTMEIDERSGHFMRSSENFRASYRETFK
ncbi:hypothetical protein AVEN_217087-1 [Araneus ventricosus]|uniref:Uncharacterized protein n=1 Tax=Araneus ventricosus TaxID=182803 RepID=A0A4Y2MJ12_ARAVE|nr:hypothetical protein AVEN_217087-1 [Araneus ventricosus]